MQKLLIVSSFVIAAASFILSSCTPVDAPQTRVIQTSQAGFGPAASQVPTMYQWNDDRGSGKVSVRINLSNQRAYFSRGGRPIGWSYVTTGVEGHATPSGTFKITEKIADKHSTLYGWTEDEYGNIVNGDAKSSDRVPAGQRYQASPMPYWLRLTNGGIGLHAGVIPKPGETASHGCIRLPKDLAPILYDAVEVGTPVTIVR